MGLDQYLEAERYFGGYEFVDEYERSCYQDLVAISDLGDVTDPNHPSARVTVTVGYWRKANAIHRWFIDNLADGIDNCEPIWVSAEDLQILYDTVAAALAAYQAGDKDGAEQILPTQPGFFFGSVEIDEWYEEDLRHTIKVLAPLLELKQDGVDLYYRASW